MPGKPRRTFVSANSIKTENMKTQTIHTDSNTSQTFLTGAILFANIDYSGFGGYAVRAAIGGLIWMVFKLAGDYLSHRMLNKKKPEPEDPSKEGGDHETK
jgi:hypothetical protein